MWLVAALVIDVTRVHASGGLLCRIGRLQENDVDVKICPVTLKAKHLIDQCSLTLSTLCGMVLISERELHTCDHLLS